MTNEEFNTAARELSVKIAKLYDDVEDQTLVISALLPLVAQTVLNCAYSKQAPTEKVLEIFYEELRDCTAKMQLFLERMKKAEGTAQ
jgi:hypothetical protein